MDVETPCPSSPGTCEWKGSLVNFLPHFKEHHPQFVIREGELYSLPSAADQNEKLCTHILIGETKNSPFALHVILDIEKNKAFFFAEMLLLGPGIKIYTITFKTIAGELTLHNSTVIGGRFKTEDSISCSAFPTANGKKQLQLTINFEPTRKLFEEFECPICLEVFRPPIFMCATGHSVCGGCSAKIDSCPLCRYRMSRTLRNFHLERIICCFVLSPRNEELSRESQDVLQLLRAPNSCCPIAAGCAWNPVKKDELLAHARASHPSRYFKSMQEYNVEVVRSALVETAYLATFDRKLFLIRFVSHIQKGLIRWKVRQVSGKMKMKYNFEVQLKKFNEGRNGPGRNSWRFQGLVDDDEGVEVPLENLLELLDEERKFFFKFSVKRMSA